VQNIRLTPGDSVIEVAWAPPADAGSMPIAKYRVRCRPSAGGDWSESLESAPTETSVSVVGLANGVEYTCEVLAVRPGDAEAWTAASVTTSPLGKPPAPGKPVAEPLDRAIHLEVAMPADAPVTGFDFECSADGGQTWTAQRTVGSDRPAIDIGGLINGTDYVCRAFATNDSGTGEASPLSDAIRPCSGLVGCNPILLVPIGSLVVVLGLGLVLAVMRRRAGRAVYVTAQVDHFAPVSLGRGPKVGMRFITRGQSNRVGGVAPAEGRAADVRIRYSGGVTFEVASGGKKRKTEFGRLVQVTDPDGRVHELVLRAYDQPPQDGRPDNV